MNRPEDFEWKGVRFSWSWHRLASKGIILLSDKTYWLLVRTKGGSWESWCEFEGGYTMACTMATRELALEGTVLALEDFLQTSLRDLELLSGESPSARDQVGSRCTFQNSEGWRCKLAPHVAGAPHDFVNWPKR